MATSPIKHVKNELVIPRGRMTIDVLDDDGQPTGEIEFGHAIIKYTSESDKAEERSAEMAASEIIGTQELNVTRTLDIECKNIDQLNYQRFLAASSETVIQAATPVTAELRRVVPGRIYQLGQTEANPSGVRTVTSITVKSENGTDTYVLGADYNADPEDGRVQIIQGGAIVSAGAVVQFGYTPVAGTFVRMKSGDSLSFKAAVRIRADNAGGSNRDLYFPLCSIAPTGEMPLANNETEYISLGFTGTVLKSANQPAVIGDERLTLA